MKNFVSSFVHGWLLLGVILTGGHSLPVVAGNETEARDKTEAETEAREATASVTTAQGANSLTTIRVANLNLRNYLAIDRRTEHGFRREWPKPEAEKQAVRRTLVAVQPDVLLLQELGSGGYLRELQRDLKANGLDLPYAIEGPETVGGRILGILSRWATTEVTSKGLTAAEAQAMGVNVPRFPDEAGNIPEAETYPAIRRGILLATFEAEGSFWTVGVMHLKSRLTENRRDPEARLQRLGEARSLAAYVDQLPAGRREYLLLGGDANAVLGTPVLRSLLSRHEAGEAVPRLIALPAYDREGRAWTYRRGATGRVERIDFLLASPVLADQAKLPAKAIEVGQRKQFGSDHRLLWVDLKFQAKTE